MHEPTHSEKRTGRKTVYFSQRIGIIVKNFVRNNFNHTICIYTEQAQQYIFDHINDIIEFNLSEN